MEYRLVAGFNTLECKTRLKAALHAFGLISE